VTGEGRGFCTGADLGGAGGRSDAFTPSGMRLSTKLYSRMIKAMTEMEKPLIGAINGDAAGAGCNFALACDLLIASENARFIQVFVRRGLVPDAGGTYFLPRLIGLAKSKELMFSGEAIDAKRALELGLVNRVVPADRLMEETMGMAAKLASGPTRAIGMIKRMLNRSFESDLGTALEMEASLQGIAVSTSDVIEGVSSFMEKRPPVFKGI
jgi:2-(1,2-epoxy-1,2-dihydrophenyl)acetyl-CoA isomerase